MKIRNDFVTNSSSSSFILSNNTDEDMSCREFVMKLMEPILEAADEEGETILAHGQIKLVCGDHILDDGAFQYFIHNVVGNKYSPNGCFASEYNTYESDDPDCCPVKVEFDESFH